MICLAVISVATPTAPPFSLTNCKTIIYCEANNDKKDNFSNFIRCFEVFFSHNSILVVNLISVTLAN